MIKKIVEHVDIFNEYLQKKGISHILFKIRCIFRQIHRKKQDYDRETVKGKYIVICYW